MSQQQGFEEALEKAKKLIDEMWGGEDHMFKLPDLQEALSTMEKAYTTAYMAGTMEIIASNIEAHLTGGNTFEEIYEANLEYFTSNGGEPNGNNNTCYTLKPTILTGYLVNARFEAPHPHLVIEKKKIREYMTSTATPSNTYLIPCDLEIYHTALEMLFKADQNKPLQIEFKLQDGKVYQLKEAKES